MTAEAEQDQIAGCRPVDPWTAEQRLSELSELLEPDEGRLADQDAPPPAWVTATAAREELPTRFWRQDSGNAESGRVLHCVRQQARPGRTGQYADLNDWPAPLRKRSWEFVV
jgi:hypothetical protein